MPKFSPTSSFGIRMGSRASKAQKARAHAAFLTKLKPFVATVVIESFCSDDGSMRNPTRNALVERTDYVKKLVDELRLEHGWSYQRIRDHLAYILRCRLIGLELPLNRLLSRSSW